VHADGFAGFNGLFGPDKADEQACVVHVRRKFFEEAERTGAPIAKEAVKRIGKLYNVEKEAKGKSPAERVALRQEKARRKPGENQEKTKRKPRESQADLR
jgi:hypothetical protein